MFQYERHRAIMSYLEQNHTATISTLAKYLYISEASVRRDVAKLEAEGLVMRVYGGVVLSEYKNDVLPVELRENANSAVKEAIAEEAAKYINNGDTVFFDASSTVRRICKHIKRLKNLKIVTTNLRVCQELKDTDITIYCTGGEYYKNRDCFLGTYTESFIKTINADSVFFSCKGLSKNGILTDVSENEVSLRQTMLAQSEKKYLLCDSSKIGQKFTFSICNSRELTKVFCDIQLPDLQ